jgi:hypothetical protein
LESGHSTPREPSADPVEEKETSNVKQVRLKPKTDDKVVVKLQTADAFKQEKAQL